MITGEKKIVSSIQPEGNKRPHGKGSIEERITQNMGKGKLLLKNEHTNDFCK